MSPLFGPILAQLVTLGLSDRTEARYIASDDKYFEVATTPRAALSFGWKHTTLSLGYGPSITFTPIDSKDQLPTELVVFHNSIVAGSYRWRHTTIGVSEYVGIGQLNLRTLALTTGAPAGGDKPGPATGGPVANGGAAGMGTGVPAANQIRASNRLITYAISSTTLSVAQVVSPVLNVYGELGYVVTGGVGKGTSADYPLVKGPRALTSGSYRMTRRDDAVSTLSWQYAAASTGNNSWVALAKETWAHALDERTNTRLGGGLSATRSSQPDGLVGYSIYPTFNASINRAAPLERGTLSFGFGASAAPVLDPVRALVDPRVSLLAMLGWGRDRFFSSLSAGSLLSLDKQNTEGALSSATGALTLGYRLGAGFSADTGIRTTWQRFEGQTTVPLSWAAFLGLTYGVALPLNGGV